MNCTTQRQIKVLTTGTNECRFNLERGSLELHSSENEVLKVGPNPIGFRVLIRRGKAIGKKTKRGNAMWHTQKTRNVKGQWPPLEAGGGGEGQERICPRVLEEA